MAGKQQYMSEPKGKPVDTQERNGEKKKKKTLARLSKSLPLPLNLRRSESFISIFCLDFVKGGVVLHIVVNIVSFTKSTMTVTI